MTEIPWQHLCLLAPAHLPACHRQEYRLNLRLLSQLSCAWSLFCRSRRAQAEQEIRCVKW